MSYGCILECYLIDSDIAMEGATLDAYKTRFHGYYRIYKSAMREGKQLEKAGQYEDASKKYNDAKTELQALAKELRSPADDTMLSNVFGFVIPIVLAMVSWFAFGKTLRLVGGAVMQYSGTGAKIINNIGHELYNESHIRTDPLMVKLIAAFSVLVQAINVYFGGGGTAKNPKTYNAVRMAAASSLDMCASQLAYRIRVIRNRKNHTR